MNILKVKIPLLMYSETENDPEDPDSCLIRKMEDLDTTLVHGKEKLRGQGYSWIFDYDTHYSSRGKEVIDGYYSRDKKFYGFNQREVMMDVTLVDGYYLAEFVTEIPLNQVVTLTRDYGDFTSVREMTLKEAILEYLEGCLSDGIGENPIGRVSYNFTEHEVWLGNAEVI